MKIKETLGYGMTMGIPEAFNDIKIELAKCDENNGRRYLSNRQQISKCCQRIFKNQELQ